MTIKYLLEVVQRCNQNNDVPISSIFMLKIQLYNEKNFSRVVSGAVKLWLLYSNLIHLVHRSVYYRLSIAPLSDILIVESLQLCSAKTLSTIKQVFYLKIGLGREIQTDTSMKNNSQRTKTTINKYLNQNIRYLWQIRPTACEARGQEPKSQYMPVPSSRHYLSIPVSHYPNPCFF